MRHSRLAKMMMLMRRGGGDGTGITYYLRDQFTTDDDAPMTTPRTCEPGPGTVTVDDECSISSGVFTLIDTSVNKGYLSVAAYGATPGLAFFVKVVDASVRGYVGWFNADRTYGYVSSGVAGGLIQEGSSYPTTLGNLIDNKTAFIIRRTNGAFFIVDGKLNWVSKRTVADSYPGLIMKNAATSSTYDEVGVAQLPAPWTDDYGIATARTELALAGATLTHEADGHVEATWTAVTGETYELSIRRTDDNNRWVVRCSETDDTCKLIEINDGEETERASTARVFHNGYAYRIIASFTGNTIIVNVGTTDMDVMANYTSATFNNTATGAKTSHAVANFVAWPHGLGEDALAPLAIIFP